MNKNNLSKILIIVITLLIINQIGIWMYSAIGAIGGVLSAIVIGGVIIYLGKVSIGRNLKYSWFIIPSLLFIVVPFFLKIWQFFTEEKTLVERIIDQVPFLVGFLIPVLLLLWVYKNLQEE
jgi:hypothetical protein